jgi:hypothetical protein
MGEMAVNIAASIGISVEQFLSLSQAMKLVGGNADTASRTF